MPNNMSGQVSPLIYTDSAELPATVEVAEASSMLRAATIVDQFEMDYIDVEDAESVALAQMEAMPRAGGGSAIAAVQRWLDAVRTGVAQTAQSAEMADPLYPTRQFFSTVPMDAETLEHFKAHLPAWDKVKEDIAKVIGDFRAGFGDDEVEEADLCKKTLTAYFERSLNIDRFSQDLMWRFGNLGSAAQSLPPYLARLTTDWMETARILGLPLAASVAYWGVEQTTACTLEISKYADDARTAEYAAKDFKLLESWRLQKNLVASVGETRELVMATGTYAKQAGELAEAVGPYVGWAVRFITAGIRNGVTEIGKIKQGIETGTRAPAPAVPPKPLAEGAAPPAHPSHATPTKPGSAGPSDEVETRVEALLRETQKLVDEVGRLGRDVAARPAPTVEPGVAVKQPEKAQKPEKPDKPEPPGQGG